MVPCAPPHRALWSPPLLESPKFTAASPAHTCPSMSWSAGSAGLGRHQHEQQELSHPLPTVLSVSLSVWCSRLVAWMVGPGLLRAPPRAPHWAEADF